MPSDNADDLTVDLVALRDLISGIDLQDAHGAAADQIRSALASHSAQLSASSQMAEAVHNALTRRATLVAQRDAQMPTDDEIRSAEHAVLAASSAAAAGTGSPEDVTKATEHLADLLLRKRTAEANFTEGQNEAAQTLEATTTQLSDTAPPWTSILGALAGMASGISTALPATGEALAGAPMSQTAPASASPSDENTAPRSSEAALLDQFEPNHGGNGSSLNPHSATTDYRPTEQAGMTHTSADLSSTPGALIGVQGPETARPANPFMATGPSSAGTPGIPSAAGAPPMMGAPMMGAPMAPGQGPTDGSSVASKAKRPHSPIIDIKDPELSGDDIDSERASSGVIGRHDGGTVTSEER